GDRRPSRALDVSRDGVQRLLTPAEEAHLGTVLRQELRNPRADPAAAARHERDLALEQPVPEDAHGSLRLLVYPRLRTEVQNPVTRCVDDLLRLLLREAEQLHEIVEDLALVIALIAVRVGE